MRKKFLLFFIFFFILQNCGYTPIYSEFKNQKFKFEIVSIDGNERMNNLTNVQIKNFSNQLSDNLLRLKIKTDYQKIILSKNKSGKATNFLLRKKIEFETLNLEKNQKLSFSEDTKTTNMDDKFEMKTYEDSIKTNFISSSIKNFILKISINQ